MTLQARIKEYDPDLHERLAQLFTQPQTLQGHLHDHAGQECVCGRKLDEQDLAICWVCDERRDG